MDLHMVMVLKNCFDMLWWWTKWSKYVQVNPSAKTCRMNLRSSTWSSSPHSPSPIAYEERYQTHTFASDIMGWSGKTWIWFSASTLPSGQLDYCSKPMSEEKRLRNSMSWISSAILHWTSVQSKILLFLWLCLGRHVLTAPLLLASMAWGQLNPNNPWAFWSLVSACVRLAPFNTKAQGMPDEALHTACSCILLLRICGWILWKQTYNQMWFSVPDLLQLDGNLCLNVQFLNLSRNVRQGPFYSNPHRMLQWSLPCQDHHLELGAIAPSKLMLLHSRLSLLNCDPWNAPINQCTWSI